MILRARDKGVAPSSPVPFAQHSRTRLTTGELTERVLSVLAVKELPYCQNTAFSLPWSRFVSFALPAGTPPLETHVNPRSFTISATNAVRQRVTAIPAHTAEDDLGFVMTPFKSVGL